MDFVDILLIQPFILTRVEDVLNLFFSAFIYSLNKLEISDLQTPADRKKLPLVNMPIDIDFTSLSVGTVGAKNVGQVGSSMRNLQSVRIKTRIKIG